MEAGVDSASLSEFIQNKCARKSKDASLQDIDLTNSQIHDLLKMGGKISGGAALKKYLYMDNSADVDVFFDDLNQFVKAHLHVYSNKRIDVCLYRNEPYELFDISSSKISFDGSDFKLDKSCEESLVTGISRICFDSIVDPKATMRRVIKYGQIYQFKFLPEEIALLGSIGQVDNDLINEAMGLT